MTEEEWGFVQWFEAAFGYRLDSEDLADIVERLRPFASPTVGTPEYEPTEPSPARLSGGAN